MSEQEAWTIVNKIAKLIEERDALVAERDEARLENSRLIAHTVAPAMRDLAARAEAAEAALKTEMELGEKWRKERLAAEAEVARLREANETAAQEIASAMTSLSTGPAKDGYAYSCLTAAATALGEDA